MAAKSVAVVGDVIAQAGTTLYGDATSGGWTHGNVSYVTYPQLIVQGQNVVYEATCKFKFDGSSGNTAITGTSDVTLTAAATLLMQNENNVLIHGDSQEDSYGNKLYVESSTILKTEKAVS